MTSERVQRQIDRLLDEAETALGAGDWDTARLRAEAVLRIEPGNADASTYLQAATRDDAITASSPAAAPAPADSAAQPQQQPTSFASGRYEVKHFLGEGGKKRVYLAHDAQLDRDVAFALIKTEGLDEQARQRITREAQAILQAAEGEEVSVKSRPNTITMLARPQKRQQPRGPRRTAGGLILPH